MEGCNHRSLSLFCFHMFIVNYWSLTIELHIVLEHVTSPFGSLKNLERNLFLAGPSSTSMLENSFCSSSDSSPLPPVDLRSSLPWDNRRMSERLDDGERSGEWGLFVGHERSKGCIWTSTILCVSLFLGHFLLLPHHFLLFSLLTCVTASMMLPNHSHWMAGHQAPSFNTILPDCRIQNPPWSSPVPKKRGLPSSCTAEVKNLR